MASGRAATTILLTAVVITGVLLTATAASARTPTPPPPTVGPVCGDVNADGLLNSVDAQLILQYAAGLIDNVPYLLLADVNGDDAVDPIDSALILQFDAGLIDTTGLACNR